MATEELTELQKQWLYHYLNKNNPETYLNATRSTIKAGYNVKDVVSAGTVGSANRRSPVISAMIAQYFEDTGLSDDHLRKKLKNLMNAKETKFFSHEGVVTDQVEVEALEVQRRTLDMALKVKGLYEKHNAQQAVVIKPPSIDRDEDSGT